MPKQWVNRPEGSTWGEFGRDDQDGRTNLLTPEKVLQGVAEVREGRVFCLSLPLNLPGSNLMVPRRHPPELKPSYEPNGDRHFHYEKSKADPAFTDIMNDDVLTIWTQYSTQWDALTHIGYRFDADGDGEAEICYYNGHRGGEDVIVPDTADAPHVGAVTMAIDRLALKGMQGRGVILDLVGHFGRSYRDVGYDDLMEVMSKDKVVVEPGDILCLHTGFDEVLLEFDGAPPDRDSLHNVCCALNGRDDRLLQWITDSRISGLVSDTFAVERPGIPSDDERRAFIPLHQHCLFKIGVPLGEMWYLAELKNWLKAHGRSRFMLTAPPLRLPGAVGSPVTPIATV
jgi:kynurenine formamidase